MGIQPSRSKLPPLRSFFPLKYPLRTKSSHLAQKKAIEQRKNIIQTKNLNDEKFGSISSKKTAVR